MTMPPPPPRSHFPRAGDEIMLVGRGLAINPTTRKPPKQDVHLIVTEVRIVHSPSYGYGAMVKGYRAYDRRQRKVTYLIPDVPEGLKVTHIWRHALYGQPH